jgi:hypothetical protein
LAKLGKAKEPKLTKALLPQDGHLMSQGDGLKLQRGAAANTEREQGSEGGKNVIMPTTVWRWRENLSTFSTFRSFEQARGEFYHRLSRRHSFLKER